MTPHAVVLLVSGSSDFVAVPSPAVVQGFYTSEFKPYGGTTVMHYYPIAKFDLKPFRSTASMSTYGHKANFPEAIVPKDKNDIILALSVFQTATREFWDAFAADAVLAAAKFVVQSIAENSTHSAFI